MGILLFGIVFSILYYSVYEIAFSQPKSVVGEIVWMWKSHPIFMALQFIFACLASVCITAFLMCVI